MQIVRRCASVSEPASTRGPGLGRTTVEGRSEAAAREAPVISQTAEILGENLSPVRAKPIIPDLANKTLDARQHGADGPVLCSR